MSQDPREPSAFVERRIDRHILALRSRNQVAAYSRYHRIAPEVAIALSFLFPSALWHKVGFQNPQSSLPRAVSDDEETVGTESKPPMFG
jgi:hypothetical protein